jgi:hypothetical protein
LHKGFPLRQIVSRVKRLDSLSARLNWQRFMIQIISNKLLYAERHDYLAVIRLSIQLIEAMRAAQVEAMQRLESASGYRLRLAGRPRRSGGRSPDKLPAGSRKDRRLVRSQA